MIISMQQSGEDVAIDSLNQTIEEHHGSVVVKRTLAMKRYERALREDLQLRVEKFQNVIPGPSLKMPAARVKSLKLDPASLGTRSFGEVDGTPVIVEWKKYDASWQGQRGIELTGRLDNLARLLNKEEEKPEELFTLHCRGYIDNIQEAQYGFVFSSPGMAEDKTISLDQLLNSPAAHTLPTLEQRY
jgi:hypothetical protein